MINSELRIRGEVGMNLVEVGYKEIQLHETLDKTVYSLVYRFSYRNGVPDNAPCAGCGLNKAAVGHLFTA